MSQTDFEKGIKAGVPENIKVAHKFSERRLGDLAQLHDCGIIYKQGRPYLLCVMTRGKNFEDLETLIGDVSREVWDEMKE